MSAFAAYVCACGTRIASEASAQRHTAVCDLQGLPGCRITVYHQGMIRPGQRSGSQYPRCGQPAGRDGLCAKHAADKERLS